MTRYEFALLRYVHDPTAEEFANIGVVMLDVDGRRLLSRASERYRRVAEFFREFDGGAFRNIVRHTERRLARIDEELRQPDVLEALPATLKGILDRTFPEDDSAIRVSPIMSGVQDDLDRRFEELFEEYVTRYDVYEERPRRDEEDVRRDLESKLVRWGMHNRVRFQVPITSATYSWDFYSGWHNGKPQVLEPISLDLADSGRIIEKANVWTGRLYNLSHGTDFGFTGVVAPPRDRRLRPAFEKAVSILEEAPRVREIVPEAKVDRVLELIELDTSH